MVPTRPNATIVVRTFQLPQQQLSEARSSTAALGRSFMCVWWWCCSLQLTGLVARAEQYILISYHPL